MENKFTQGPWTVSRMVNDYSIFSDKDKEIAAAYQYSRNIDKEEAEANAKLIAAAPELLAALIRFQEEWIVSGNPAQRANNHTIERQINAAIQKAIY